MKKVRQQKFNSHLFILIILSILAILVPIYRNSNFNQDIPDVVEIPQEVKDSIKNLKPQKSFKVLILLYHYVEYVKDQGDTIRKSLNITPYTFEEEIKTLKDAGYVFITPRDLANALDDKVSLSPKSVILSFDDGYRDFYTDVFPILKKYQVKAVAYIVPNFLNKPNNMDAWMVKEISKSGLVEIGAHTMDHMYLSGLPRDRVEYEVRQSKKYLEKLLGIKIVSFAYPYGAFDNQAIDVVKNAGFKSAVTTIPGEWSMDINRFFLYRVRPGGMVGGALFDIIKTQSLKADTFLR